MRSLHPRLSTKRLPLACIFVATVLSLLLSACGGAPTTPGTGNGPSTTPTKPVKVDVKAPTDLLQSGTLVVGSDTTYVPMEYVDTKSNTYVGFDIDLIRAMAAHMGLKPQIQKTSFTTIFDDLKNKRFDVVISSVTVDSDRQKKFDFMPYFNAGESLLVPRGNPKNLKSASDLCGLNVGVQDGTTEQKELQAQSEKCKASGKQAITMMVLQSQTDVVQLLATQRADATYQDSPVTDYYNKIHPGQFEIGGSVVNAAPYGIVVRKGDTAMLDAMQKAFKAVKDDGTYDNLFKNWDFSDQEKAQ
jgi:polar amino acid transport system substrate-binding protein